MGYELVITLAILALVVVALFQERVGPEVVMLTALLLLVFLRVISMQDALTGFASPSVMTIGSLYVVGAGLRSTGGLEAISRWLLGRPTAQTRLIRLLAPISGLAGFMNTTPLVAFFLPVFSQLAKRLRISPSRLLMPLSYAAILGGTCTLVGTSTNLVVDGLLRKEGLRPLSLFELTPVGLAVTIAGLTYLTTLGRRLLPDRQDLLEYMETHPREYAIEMIVRANCLLAGQTVRGAGLRDLPGLYLFRIERGRTLISPVSPTETILVGDILSFSGMAATVVDLQRIRGLDPVEHRSPVIAASTNAGPSAGSLDSMEGLPETAEPAPAPRQGRQLCEVVIAPASPLVARSIKDADFRARYNAAIIAVHRSGEKLQQKIGQIVLHAGDTLLVDADDDFVRRWRHSPDFILVSGVDDSAPVAHERAWLSLLIFGGVLIGMSIADNQAAVIALAGAALMILCRCVRSQDGQRSIDLSVLVLVASSFGLSKALETSGAARLLADWLISICSGYGHLAVMAMLYLLTVLLSELLSNNATAALMGSLAIATARQLNIDPRPLMIAIAIGASCAFASPIGCQANLMVMNPGGYRFKDYLKVGLPLNLLCFAVAMIVIPLVWGTGPAVPH